MDQALLVEDQISEGRELIEQLIQHGLDVMGACWLKREDSNWRLYIVSPIVESDKPAEAYRCAQPVIQQRSRFYWVDSMDFSFIGPSDSIAKEILEFRQRFPGARPNYFRGNRFAGRYIDGAYIYPLPSVMLSQSAGSRANSGPP